MWIGGYPLVKDTASPKLSPHAPLKIGRDTRNTNKPILKFWLVMLGRVFEAVVQLVVYICNYPCVISHRGLVG